MGSAFDSVGGEQLSALTRCMQQHGLFVRGSVTLGGIELSTTALPFILRGVRLIGVDSGYTPMTMRRAVWQRLAITEPRHLKDIVHTITLRRYPGDFRSVLKQQSRGKSWCR